MLLYIERLEREAEEVKSRIRRLEDAIASVYIKKSKKQRELMEKQLEAMKAYYSATAERLAYEKELKS